MGLRLKGMESLHKLVICRWPQEHGTSEARWDWEYQPMNAGPEKDSCVVLYWDARDLKAGEKRAMGYTYGLGRIADEAEQAPMRLLAGGAAKTGRPFVLSFYIQGGKVGSKVKLRLPAGLALADGEKEEKIIQAHNIKDYAQVSWRVLAARVGRYTVKAVLDERETQQEVHVRESSIFD